MTVALAGVLLVNQPAMAVSKKDVTSKTYTVDDGYVIEYKNTSKKPVEVKGVCRFYLKGDLLSDDQEVAYCIGAGETYYAHFQAYTGKYDKHKITYKVSKSYYKSRKKDIKVSVSKEDKYKATLKAKWVRGKKIKYAKVGVLYLDKDKKPVGMREKYVYFAKKNKNYSYTVEAPSNYSSCKAVVNYAYSD